MLSRLRTFARSSSQAVRQKSSTSFEREAVSEKSAWEKFVPHAPAFGIGFATLTVSFYTGYFMKKWVNSWDKELALAEVKTAKDFEVEMAKKDFEVEMAKKDLEVAKKETAKLVLLLDDAEEFQRYQKQAGIHKGGK
jgi:hypothetical protein